ncbi:ABC-type transport auxiliary lipoprotein family protein [Methylococcus sp. EFPC2]|uniref:ABC-type transport auxiliary lipoprotein family protein n=1 Tax=Methylococcus sp. EFPC2 TaxID=2812648 RepID=UPI0019676A23|nr:ABC-type transport auxiliary lipoprotein family protein [Methylococcus sp. EFPC2]QSA98151.1 membrane integrity-associated transporter subunit PqiC [Methylococcus sp. EFPC2]
MPVTSVAVEAPDWLKDPRIHYRLLYADPTRVRFYADNRWLAPPPDLLAQRLAAAGAGRPYRLRIRLREFEQVFDTPDRARIVLGIVARAESLEHGEFVAERRFDFALSTSSPDAQGAVQAFSTAVDQAAGEIGAWLESLANRPGQPASPAP